MEIEDQVKAVLNGKLRLRRFNEAEQSGSSHLADGFLWYCILCAEAELAETGSRAICEGHSPPSLREVPPYRFLRSVSIPLPGSFDQLLEVMGEYQDRGRESIVCNSGDGSVRKLRPMRPSSLSGYMAPFANIVYHNRLFPADRYVLENIFCRDDEYFMVLKQRRIEILLDNQGFPVKPTTEQVRSAIDRLGARLFEYLGDDSDENASSETSESEDDVERMRFYNSEYYISDLQPGRNTVIDSETGAVHFIDPRIVLNDPDGPMTKVSRFGKRSESISGFVQLPL